MLKRSKIVYFTCLLWLLFSCNRSQMSSSSVSAYQTSSSAKEFSLEDPAINRFIVIPEIAVMKTKIRVTASSFDEVAKLIEVNSQKVLKSIDNIEGCSARILDYQHPVEQRAGKLGKAFLFSSLELEILISFAEMKNVKERIKRVNNCLQGIPELTIEKKQKNVTIHHVRSDVMPTIQNAQKYRQKLLESKFTALKEVANLSEPATQFNASDTRCTSKGIVKVVKRSLSGIELDIDFDCYVRKLESNSR